MHRIIYASDSSSYREFPLGIVVPEGVEDLRTIVRYAGEHGIPLVPRGAGTSLAGQVVGDGLVVDLRKFDKILGLDTDARTVRVEPGVIRDSLNDWLAPHGLLFGPETSTTNRAVIGGMVGNNSCGMHSLIWGSTRDHLVSCKAMLADGSEVVFEALSPEAFHAKRQLPTLEGRVYDDLYRRLSDPATRREIEAGFPKPEIHRRNNGYAVDLLLRSNVFTPGGPDFNLCKLVCGSEGTLCLVTEATLHLVPKLSPVIGLVTMHFNDSIESMRATLVALKHKPTACELIGDFHVQQALANNKVNPNNLVGQCSQWIQGEPQTVIVVEFAGDSREEVESRANAMVAEIKSLGMGYAWPLWFGAAADKIWTLRRALGGINSSRPGDVKSFDLIEDCAIDPQDLPEYVTQLEGMLSRAGVQFTQSAHVGAGELHTIVFLNPKTREGRRLYRWILDNVASLVKSFRGSLSGEHGDGRMRAEFLPKMIGDANYRLCCDVKDLFDGANIFNPGKIVARATDGHVVALFAGVADAGDRDLLRLEPRPRRRARRGTVQRHRRVQEGQQRADVPELHGHPRGERLDPGARQRAARVPDPLDQGEPLRPPGDQGRPRPVPVLQGLQERVPCRRRHGEAEGGVSAALARRPPGASAHPGDRELCVADAVDHPVRPGLQLLGWQSADRGRHQVGARLRAGALDPEAVPRHAGGLVPEEPCQRAGRERPPRAPLLRRVHRRQRRRGRDGCGDAARGARLRGAAGAARRVWQGDDLAGVSQKGEAARRGQRRLPAREGQRRRAAGRHRALGHLLLQGRISRTSCHPNCGKWHARWPAAA